MTPNRRRLWDIFFIMTIFAVLGVQLIDGLRHDSSPTSQEGTYEIAADGSKSPLVGTEEGRENVPTPAWAKRLTVTLGIVSSLLTLPFLFIFLRASFAPTTFRLFRFGYVLVVAEFLMAVAYFAPPIFFKECRFDNSGAHLPSYGFMSILFGMMLWQRLVLLRYERSQRTLDALEVK